MKTPPESTGFRKRVAGSARFSAYYKVQWYDAAALCWRDIQARHETPEAAKKAARRKPGLQCRIMEVTEAGRRII